MPNGEPNKRTIATEKYQKKAGYMSKTYKLKRDLVEQFDEACKTSGKSQAGVISSLMREYITSIKE